MKLSKVYITVLAFCVATSNLLMAQTAPSFGAAQTFSVLAYATVTNTGPTKVSCNVGVSPGSAVTGFLPGIIQNGQIYAEVASLAGPAMSRANEVYNLLKAQPALLVNDLTGKVLGETVGAITLNPGIYTFSSSAQLNATLTLNDGGDPNAVFIFKIGSTITTASYSKVVMSSGGKGTNVFWQVGSSATIGTYTKFCGNIIALASITMTTGCTTTGKLFALNGAVTMDTNEVQLGLTSCNGIADADGDGVPDNVDDYPFDAKKAYNNYSSALGSTAAFEDQWPSKGDFDMNDLIMESRYNAVTNANNIVVQVIGNFTLVATGGSAKNGFGIQFPIPGAMVDSLQGGVLEAGQDKAVIVLFTNMRSEMVNWNTKPGEPQSPKKSYTIRFNLINGPLLSVFGTEYNPFMFNYVGTSRREVHFTGKAPTTLADASLFGTKDDDTNLAAGRYYISKSGIPFSLNLPGIGLNYSVEYKGLSSTYLHFTDWVVSGGTLFIDWYSNTGAGYRNNALIYVR
jgi:LruC domain-containing protein